MKAVLVQTTVPERHWGEKLAEELLNLKLAACVWILPPMTAYYTWEGKRESAEEHLVVIKTFDDHRSGVERRLKALHPYDCPEILTIHTDYVESGYLSWMRDVMT
ncbi:MAG: divalent-cation tolerance protein CutA [Verrucomicrobiota bacterium]